MDQKTLSNLIEYNQPEIYEYEYGKFTADFDIFCNKVTKGEALDIACGTGRIAFKLTELGLNCTGIDGSEPMLAFAKEKAKNKGLEILFLNLDMKIFSLNKKFDLITMAGNSFQFLLNEADQKQCLETIASHMTDSGFFILILRNINSDEMRTTNEFEHWHDFNYKDNQIVKVFGKQCFDPKTNIVKYTTKRIGTNFEFINDLKIKFTSYPDLMALFKNAGLNIVQIFGDFNKEPFDSQTSKNIILYCQKST